MMMMIICTNSMRINIIKKYWIFKVFFFIEWDYHLISVFVCFYVMGNMCYICWSTLSAPEKGQFGHDEWSFWSVHHIFSLQIFYWGFLDSNIKLLNLQGYWAIVWVLLVCLFCCCCVAVCFFLFCLLFWLLKIPNNYCHSFSFNIINQTSGQSIYFSYIFYCRKNNLENPRLLKRKNEYRFTSSSLDQFILINLVAAKFKSHGFT